MSIKPRDELYVTHPSNVPGHTGNTPAEYTTTLSTPLVLSGNWEVALLEAHYFNDWVNFPETNMAIFLKAKKVNVDEGLYSAGRNKRAATTPLPATAAPSQPADVFSEHLLGAQHVDDTPTVTEVVKPPTPKAGAVKIDFDKMVEEGIERSNQIDQHIRNLEEEIRKLKDEPCPLKQPVKLPAYTTEIEVKADVFFGKMFEFLKKHGGLYGEELIPIKIPRGHYDSISQIGELITKRIDPAQEMKSNYSTITEKFEFSNKLYELIFASREAYVFDRLGYNSSKKEIDNLSFYLARVDREGDMRATLEDINTIFVYSDIVDYQLVGNTKATLMGVFPTTGRHYDQQSWQFNPFQYIAVSSEEIRSITMSMRTPEGDPVPFLSGNSLCRLHFRRKLL